MLKILGILLSGVLLGYLLRGRISQKWVANSTSILIYILLLVLGIAVGSNEIIVRNLATIGVKGAVIALASTLGSLIIAKLLFYLLNKRIRNER